MSKRARHTKSTFGMLFSAGPKKRETFVHRQDDEKDTRDSLSDSVREVNSLVVGSPDILHRPIFPLVGETAQNSGKEIVALEELQKPDSLHDPISLPGPEPVQQPSLETVAAEEQKSDDLSQCVAAAPSQLHSVGGSRPVDEVKENRSASRAGTLWGKILRLFRINSRPARRSQDIPRRSRDQARVIPRRVEGSRIAIVRDLRNFFVPPRQQHNSSGRSRVQHKYYIVQNGGLARISKVPPQADRLKSLWSLSDSEQQNQHNDSGAVSREESEQSIPLLEYREIQQVDNVAGGHSTSVIEGRHLTPPWVLRKWNLKSSQRLLRIHPAKEVLFQRTDDADKYSCSIIMENKTKRYVAFKFKCTCPTGYQMKPTHGILAPNLRIEVKGLRIGDPLLSSSRGKKDLFVIVTLPIPESLIQNKSVGSKVFDRFRDQCSCEAVLRAVFTEPDMKGNMSEGGGRTKIMGYLRNRPKSKPLTAIPEEPYTVCMNDRVTFEY